MSPPAAAAVTFSYVELLTDSHPAGGFQAVDLTGTKSRLPTLTFWSLVRKDFP